MSVVAEHRVTVSNEFASVRVTYERTRNGSRLRVLDLDSGAGVVLDALTLASLCQASAVERDNWLCVGSYVTPDRSNSI